MVVGHNHLKVGWKHFWSRIFLLIRHPVFLVVTLLGNALVFAAAVGLYWVEAEINPDISNFFDALYWSIATVTTVGYGDIVPMTLTGRIITVFLIVSGTGLFFSYVALLSSLFVELGVAELEEEVEALRKGINKIAKPKK